MDAVGRQWLKNGEGWDSLKGGLDPNVDGRFLIDQALKVAHSGMVGFDTGCFTGWTASRVWDVFNANGGHFYCVDWFRGNVGSVVGDFWSSEMAAEDPSKQAYPSETVLLQLLKNIESSGASNYVSVMISESWRPAGLLKDKSVDYVYIGGDHRYSGIKRDLLAWLPKVRPGGVICGHGYDNYIDPKSELWATLCLKPELDYDHEAGAHFGINRALHELFTVRGRDIDLAGNCWAVTV